MIRFGHGLPHVVAVVRALIFDLDGVIVDSNPVHEQVWQRYLRSLGFPPQTRLASRMYGRRNDEIVRDLLGEQLSPEEVFFHGAAKEALYRESMKSQLQERLVPGVREFLEAHKEIPTGLATNAEPANAEFILAGSGLKDYFSVVVDGHQVERPKPDPEIYLHAASLLAAHPSDCVVFEDSIAGVQAARAAGARVVALATTHDSFPQADLVVRDFLAPELEPWLMRQAASR